MTTVSIAGGAAGGVAQTRTRASVSASSADALLVRLRDVAGRLVAFSETKTLLREAASMIERLTQDAERLERDAGRLGAELTRVTAEVAHRPNRTS